jgi:hypothetical protein
MFLPLPTPIRRFVIRLNLSLTFLAGIGLSTCLAQDTGNIVGQVRDQTKSGMPGVDVQAVNHRTRRRYGTKTNRNGGFVIVELPPGDYYITASKQDYRTICIPPTYIHLDRNNPVKYPPNIELGGRSSEQACRELKIAAAEPKGAKTLAAAAEPGADQWQELAIDEDTSRGGPRAASYNIIITLEREVDEASPQNSPQTAAQPTNTSSPEPEAIGMVNTVDAVRGGNFIERQIEALPLGAASIMRSFDDLALLVAGVAPPPYMPGARGPGVGFGVGTAGQFSVNGARARANDFSVDGSDTNDPDVGVRRGGYVAQVPLSIESVQEVSVSTLLWSARLGRNSGSQVNAVSKYGGNDFHGQVYGFFNDSRLNARNFFDYTGGAAGGKDPFTRAQAGAVLGGPVVRDRTHFFASVERAKINASTEQHFSTPTLDERRVFGGQPFGVQRVEEIKVFGPFERITPLGRNVLSFYPEPDANPAGPYGKNNFTQILPADGEGTMTSFKLTHQVSTGHSLDARYNFTNDGRVLPSVNRAMRSTLEARTRSQNLSVIFGSSLGARLFNQARFSFGRTRLNFPEHRGGPFTFSKSSIETVPVVGGLAENRASQTGAIGELIVEPFSPIGVGVVTFPQRRASNTFQYADTLSWARSDHSIRFGSAVRRYQLNSLSDRLYRPQVVYGGGYIKRPSDFNPFSPDDDPFEPGTPILGVELASLGVASSVLQTITSGPPNSAIGLRFTEYHVFINDNWRIRPKLTLDLGLRYEYNTVPREVNGRIERALRLENLPAPGNSRFDTEDRTKTFNNAVDAYRLILDGRTRIYEPDRNNFGPHAGFAWSLGSSGRMALRAGYGIYHDTIPGAVVSQSRNVFPNEIPINVDPTFLQFDVFNLNHPSFLALEEGGRTTYLLRRGACNQFGTCNQFGGAPGDFVALIGQVFRQNKLGGLAFTLPEKNLRASYAQQWHLTIEREVFGDHFLSAAYAGAKGTKLTRLTTPNLGPNVTPSIELLRANHIPFPVILNHSVQGGFTSRPPVCTFTGSTAVCGIAPGLVPRPAPALGAYQILENSASSNYHALQLEARNRFGRGYQFTASYTWSHAIDDVSDVFPIAGAPVVAQNSFDLRLERGDANYDLRHRFVASLIWESPFRPNAGGVGRLLGGWQIASIFQAQTGQPFTLNVAFDANLYGNLSDRPSTTNGLVFFDRHGPRGIELAPGRKLTDFFNLAGNGLVRRNTVRGDGFINLDLALSRTFSVAEWQKLSFRAEFFNVLNRANFGLPIRVIVAPGFGSAVDTANPARMVQFALKYSF